MTTVKAFIFAGLYFHLFAAPDLIASLNFCQIFTSSKPSLEFFDCSPSSNFHLLKPLAKMVKIKTGQKNPLLQYLVWAYHQMVKNHVAI